MRQVCEAIRSLLQYGIHHNLLDPLEYDYAYNKLLDLLAIEDCIATDVSTILLEEPSAILQPILDYAVTAKKIPVDTIKQRDIFEAKIMDIIIPRPREVVRRFEAYETPQEQTNFFYDFSKKNNYIKTSRTDKNITWKAPTDYGVMDITINLSKPEKDPKDIIVQGHSSEDRYPSCLLCKENVGYNGLSTGVGRTNHRIIPVILNEESFFLQYSPYVYYNEHCIVFQNEHTPMNVSAKTFTRLFDFLDQFPHYFLGSNAGLPIVGGSILSHEHYQGGRYHFPIEDAKVLQSFTTKNTTVEMLHWPLSVIRLRSKHRDELIEHAMKLYNYWIGYNNEDLGIYAYTDGTPHNAITPIARMKDGSYELDITLRNNRTSEQFPLGIFHPHPEHHHIKKENIGLIEVMGLAVLPARLQQELDIIKKALVHNHDLPASAAIHQQWFDELQAMNFDDIEHLIQEQVAIKFTKVIENAGVFKQTDDGQQTFAQFMQEVQHVLN